MQLLSVKGMHCSHCSGRVEETLRALPGVGTVVVDLEAETATVQGVASMDALVSAVNAIGFQAAPAVPAAGSPSSSSPSSLQLQTLLRVTGMHCEHCSGRVEETLAALPGVLAASVDLAAETATVRGTATVAELVAAVEAVGFGCEALSPSQQQQQQPQQQQPPPPQPQQPQPPLGSVGALPLAAASALSTSSGAARTRQPPVFPAMASKTPAEACEAGPADEAGPVDESEGLLNGSGRAPSWAASKFERTLTVAVEGMTCTACVGAVERGLRAHPGVLSASVSLMGKAAKIRYDERSTRPDEIAC